MFEKAISKLKSVKNVFKITGDKKFFLIFLVVRILSVCLVQTWYVPDEYWQSLEVSHNLVFGYGYKTWEWLLGLRSYIHPLIFAGVYQILYYLGLDNVSTLVTGPRILQALISAYADLKLYQFSGRQKWAVYCTATSWFWFYTGSRTLINTLEACLTVIALNYFPFETNPKKEAQSLKFYWIAALSMLIRPTAAIFWTPLIFYHIFFSNERKNILGVIFKYFFVSLVTFLTVFGIESYFYGKIIFPPFQFLKFNIFENISTFYGSQPFHWYLSQGLPAVLGINLLPLILNIIQSFKTRNRKNILLILTIFFNIAVLSLIPHKEFRFLLPILHISIYLASDFISKWSRKAKKLYLWLTAAIIFVSNFGPAMYLGLVHQRGTLDVMEPLSEIAHSRPNDTSMLFLMPCHSTPLYSHLHVNVSTRFLTCEPNFGLENNENYKDESDIFYENPNKWLHDKYPPTGALPSHIICFDVLVPRLSSILSRYKQVYRFPHTNVPLTSKIGHNVVVYQHLDY